VGFVITFGVVCGVGFYLPFSSLLSSDEGGTGLAPSRITGDTEPSPTPNERNGEKGRERIVHSPGYLGGCLGPVNWAKIIRAGALPLDGPRREGVRFLTYVLFRYSDFVMEGSDGAVFASLCVVVYSSVSTFLVELLLPLTGNGAHDLGGLYFFPGFYPVVECPLVVALRACRWSGVVRLRMASRLLGVGVVLGLVDCDRSKG